MTEKYADLLPGIDEELLDSTISRLLEAARDAVQALPERPSVLGYSGGIDSGILASLVAEFGKKVSLLTMGRSSSSDVASVIGKSKASLQLDSAVAVIERSDVENAAMHVLDFGSVSNLSHFEDCVAFWLIAETASKLGGKECVISANGPDELFCGYDRFRRLLDSSGYESVNEEIRNSLVVAEGLSRRVKMVVSHFGLGIQEPFLTSEFTQMALQIPAQYKILPKNDILRKRIWRCLGRSIGVPEEIVLRPKKAMQYGMGIHGIVNSMMKRGSLRLEFEIKKKK